MPQRLSCFKCGGKKGMLLKVLVLSPATGLPVQQWWCRLCIREAFGGG